MRWGFDNDPTELMGYIRLYIKLSTQDQVSIIAIASEFLSHRTHIHDKEEIMTR